MLRLPDDTHRVTINGRTGSGKTIFASHLLSTAANFHEMPWTIIDFKIDEFLPMIPAKAASVFKDPPKKPGLYYMNPAPHDRGAIHDWLWKVWHRGFHGLFIDEGYMIPDQLSRVNNPFKTLLAQGRALHIPVWTLSQRPVELNSHVFSEADYYISFHCNDAADRNRIAEFTPSERPEWDPDRKIPKYHCRWYDVGIDFSCLLRPCPVPDDIMAKFIKRLTPKKKFL